MSRAWVNKNGHCECSASPDIIDQYRDVFEGLGCLEKEYHIEMEPAVSPSQQAPKRVPVALKEQLKEKFDDLTIKGIIKPITEYTAWISNLVVIKKPGKLRVCIDPKEQNKAIRRPKYQMPTLEEILLNLAQARIFTVSDAKDGFHQVKLDQQSSGPTTFGPHMADISISGCHSESRQCRKNYSVACTRYAKG